MDHDQIQIINNNGSDTYIFTDNEEFTFQYRDQWGNTDEITAEVDYIDRTPPEIACLFDKTEIINTNVQATFTLSDKHDLTVLNDEYIDTYEGRYSIVDTNTRKYVFTENGDFLLKVVDAAGNRRDYPIQVDWIDKEIPTAIIEYSTHEPTEESVTATVYCLDNSGLPVTITNNQGSNQYVFENNDSFTFVFKDAAGNMNSITADVTWIFKADWDNLSIHYSTTESTPYKVTAWLRTSDKYNKIFYENGEEAQVDYFGNVMSHTFGLNGEYTFAFFDRFGNRGEMTAEVTWIEYIVPEVKVNYSGGPPYYVYGAPTQGPVTATLVLSKDYGKGFRITSNGGTNKYTFDENGSFTFEFENDYGLAGEALASVDWLDKTPPVFERFEYNPGGDSPAVSKGTMIIVYARDQEDGGIYKNWLTVLENGNFEINVSDMAGNMLTVPITVDWIDITPPPTVIIEKSTETVTNEDVVLTFTGDKNFHLFVLDEKNTDYLYPRETLDDEHQLVVRENCTLLVRGVDAVLNYAVFPGGTSPTIIIDNIDKTGPVLEYSGRDTLVMEKRELASLDQLLKNHLKATDNRDGDITHKIQIKLKHTEYNDIGDESRDYEFSVRDEAGNISSTVEARVIVMEERYMPRIFINGKEAGEVFTVNTGGNEAALPGTVIVPQFNNNRFMLSTVMNLEMAYLNMNFFGMSGEYTVKLLPGWVPVSRFKNLYLDSVIYNSVFDDSEMVPIALTPGEYTLYIYDQERAGKLVWIKVIEGGKQ